MSQYDAELHHNVSPVCSDVAAPCSTKFAGAQHADITSALHLFLRTRANGNCTTESPHCHGIIDPSCLERRLSGADLGSFEPYTVENRDVADDSLSFSPGNQAVVDFSVDNIRAYSVSLRRSPCSRENPIPSPEMVAKAARSSVSRYNYPVSFSTWGFPKSHC